MIRKIYEIEGIVQGVGFRPSVYNLAISSKLGGHVKNCSGKVLLSLEGNENSIAKFIHDLEEKLPIQSKITSIKLIKTEECLNKSKFKILESENDNNYKVSIPSDLAMCKDCKTEINNPNDRHYRYAFTTCVNCGPRYTVVNSMPYDRCRTTLADFQLCDECKGEYNDPDNRRFHAESIACPFCGPQLFLYDKNGLPIQDKDPITKTKNALKHGKIVAIKGIGGFLLALDARNEKTITELRIRKKRPHKPLAVMAKDTTVIKKYCKLSSQEIKLLSSAEAPIVILKLKKNTSFNSFLKLLSPDTNTLGVMLPYSPLHSLLFDEDLDLLVMTSGNKYGEPICIKNEEAFKYLHGIADLFLCHNREINLRNDDSLTTIQDGKTQIWRRSRGFAPHGLKLKNKLHKTILSMGAELKNTITLAFDDLAIISPHIGNLETPKAIHEIEQTIKYFPLFFRKKPEVIITDLHPDMHSTIIGEKISSQENIPCIKIQHHCAHAYSCMGEHSLQESLALVFDGTGLGYDNTIWGAELLYIEKEISTRLATFKAVALPGGDAAVEKINRQLIARWLDANIEPLVTDVESMNISEEELFLLKLQCSRGLNSPKTHAAGRLFDSISALLGIAPSLITYEGQAAIRLESLANKALKPSLNNFFTFSSYESNDIFFIDWSPIFKKFTPDFRQKIFKSKNYAILQRQYALDFHFAVASSIIKMTNFALSKVKTKNIVLSGGVFMNKILTSLAAEQLKKHFNLSVYIHEKVPPNDGGISFGQAVAASYLVAKNSSLC